MKRSFLTQSNEEVNSPKREKLSKPKSETSGTKIEPSSEQPRKVVSTPKLETWTTKSSGGDTKTRCDPKAGKSSKLRPAAIQAAIITIDFSKRCEFCSFITDTVSGLKLHQMHRHSDIFREQCKFVNYHYGDQLPAAFSRTDASAAVSRVEAVEAKVDLVAVSPPKASILSSKVKKQMERNFKMVEEATKFFAYVKVEGFSCSECEFLSTDFALFSSHKSRHRSRDVGFDKDKIERPEEKPQDELQAEHQAEPSATNECLDCGKILSSRYSLVRHTTSVHKRQKEEPRTVKNVENLLIRTDDNERSYNGTSFLGQNRRREFLKQT